MAGTWTALTRVSMGNHDHGNIVVVYPEGGHMGPENMSVPVEISLTLRVVL